MKPKAIICDLDGTLADSSHREHFLKRNPPDWAAFYEAMGADRPHGWCRDILRGLVEHEILFLTGRPERYRIPTVDWLGRCGFHAQRYQLFMRGDNDRSAAPAMKKAVYQASIAPCWDARLALDDHQATVEMWRGLGIVCLHCAGPVS